MPHLTSPASRLRTLGATTARELAAARCAHAAKVTWSEQAGHCTTSETARLRAALHVRISADPAVQSIQRDVDRINGETRQPRLGLIVVAGLIVVGLATLAVALATALVCLIGEL
jgi:Mrp family chromosome partitioning ATPase